MSPKGRTILITGAASGIGLAVARAAAEAGARLILIDRDDAALAAAASGLGADLLSDDAALMTGSVLVSDGGYTL